MMRSSIVLVLGVLSLPAKAGKVEEIPNPHHFNKSAKIKIHPGPMGLPWRKSPATAKSVLRKSLRFLTEREAEVNGFHVVDQFYKGRFADLPMTRMQLSYFQGEFYRIYMVVQPFTRASKLFEVVVQKMNETYGEPKKITKPKALYSGQSNLSYSNLDAKQKNMMSLYRQDSTTDQGKYALMDAQIAAGMWYPRAEWVFKNDVEAKLRVAPTAKQGEFVTTWEFVYLPLAKHAKAPAQWPARDY